MYFLRVYKYSRKHLYFWPPLVFIYLLILSYVQFSKFIIPLMVSLCSGPVFSKLTFIRPSSFWCGGSLNLDLCRRSDFKIVGPTSIPSTKVNISVGTTRFDSVCERRKTPRRCKEGEEDARLGLTPSSLRKLFSTKNSPIKFTSKRSAWRRVAVILRTSTSWKWLVPSTLGLACWGRGLSQRRGRSRFQASAVISRNCTPCSRICPKPASLPLPLWLTWAPTAVTRVRLLKNAWRVMRQPSDLVFPSKSKNIRPWMCLSPKISSIWQHASICGLSPSPCRRWRPPCTVDLWGFCAQYPKKVASDVTNCCIFDNQVTLTWFFLSFFSLEYIRTVNFYCSFSSQLTLWLFALLLLLQIFQHSITSESEKNVRNFSYENISVRSVRNSWLFVRLQRQIDCWQSFFISLFSRGEENRRTDRVNLFFRQKSNLGAATHTASLHKKYFFCYLFGKK